MVAYVALYIWPLVVIVLFNRCTLPVALIWSIIAGYLLLPTLVGVDLPLLPRINKDLIPSLSALLMAIFVTRLQPASGRDLPGTQVQSTVLPGWIPRASSGRIFLAMIVGGAFLTTLTNGDTLVYATTVLRGLSIYDGFSAVMNAFVGLLPFFLARKYLADPESHRKLLFILCIAGLIYTLPALYEIRMSPQLNKMIYGFFPSAWIQHIRADGFRPIVFLEHGLWLGIFFSGATLASLAYLRATPGAERWLYLGAAFWVLFTLVLAKTLGALMITLVFIPIVLFFGVRLQLLAAASIALVVISFPVLRGAGYIPLEPVLSVAEKIDPSRAGSLRFRLENEDRLLAKAKQRPIFGWGGWSRSRVFDEQGRDISVTDGRWIISIGQGGWVRYIAEFGLLSMPILMLTLRRRRYQVTLATSGLCLVLAANLVDLIPNAGSSPLTWLMAGALMGRLEAEKAKLAKQARAPLKFSRQPPDSVLAAQETDATDQQPAEPLKRPKRLAYTRQTHLKPGTGGAKT